MTKEEVEERAMCYAIGQFLSGYELKGRTFKKFFEEFSEGKLIEDDDYIVWEDYENDDLEEISYYVLTLYKVFLKFYEETKNEESK